MSTPATLSASLTACGSTRAEAADSSFRSEGRADAARLGSFVGDLPEGLLFRLPHTAGTDAAG